MVILGNLRRRIDTYNIFFLTSLPAQENCGGNRMSAKYLIKKESVVNFINTFKAIERHTVGRRSERLYLDSNLNITKLYTHIL